MSGIYLDAALTDRLFPLFNGTREATIRYLLGDRDKTVARIFVGETKELLLVDEYLERFAAGSFS